MEEAIDYNAVIRQLQLENEMLRSHLKAFMEMRETLFKVPNLVEELWTKATANKYQLLIGIMIIYWAASVGFMFYDRLRGRV